MYRSFGNVIILQMAVPAEIGPDKRFPQPGDAGYPPGKRGQDGILELPNGERIPVERDLIREAAARLYGQGYKRKQIARILAWHLEPHARNQEQAEAAGRTKLRRWEKQESFRDLVYNQAVVELDMSTPEILQGVAQKAKRGRVDAARLALEVTGRHNPKGEVAPTNVQVVFANLPRPS